MTKPPPKVSWSEAELEALRPPERITISEWSAKYREFGGASEYKGPYLIEMAPYMAPIMDACYSFDVDEIGCCKPAQISGTESLVCNVVGFYTHQMPSVIMVALEDEKTSGDINNDKVQNMYQHSRALKHLYVKKKFSKEKLNFITGSIVYFAWASSVAQFGSKTCRITIGDEIDKSGWNKHGVEANPMSLLRERTKAVAKGLFKHIWLSTPTTKEGNITVMMNTFDIVYDWHVPCPHCGQLQPLRWSVKHQYGFDGGVFRDSNGKSKKLGQVVWDGGRKATRRQILDTARYQCGECEGKWTTVQKNEAVRNGTMVPRTEPVGDERKIFFHLTRLIALFDAGDLATMVQDWCDIYKKHGEDFRKAMQGFINSTLAEPFEETIVSKTTSKILKARVALLPMTCPHDVVAITAGIDVQKRNFWFAVRAWLNDYTSWLIHYGSLATWLDVENLLFKAMYTIEDSDIKIPIWRAAVDTGGGEKYEGLSMTEETERWVRKNGTGRGARVYGTKGASHTMVGKIKVGTPLDKYPSGTAIPGGLQIIQLETNKLKDMYHYRLDAAIGRLENGEMSDCAAFLHKNTDEQYAKHILAEEKKRNDKGVEEWVQVGKRNDLLDCEILAMACAEPEWPGGGVNLLQPVLENAKNNANQELKQSRVKFVTNGR